MSKRGKNGRFTKNNNEVNNEKKEEIKKEVLIKEDDYYARKNKEYKENKFYREFMDGHGRGNTARKVIVAAAKTFLNTSEHPMTRLVRETMHDIFS